MALMGRPPGDFGVESEAFGPNPHVIIASADHPLRRRRRVSKAELANQKFLVREEGSGTRSIFEYLFNEAGIRHPRDSIEMGSNEAIKHAVMADRRLSFFLAATDDVDFATRRQAH